MKNFSEEYLRQFYPACCNTPELRAEYENHIDGHRIEGLEGVLESSGSDHISNLGALNEKMISSDGLSCLSRSTGEV